MNSYIAKIFFHDRLLTKTIRLADTSQQAMADELNDAVKSGVFKWQNTLNINEIRIVAELNM